MKKIITALSLMVFAVVLIACTKSYRVDFESNLGTPVDSITNLESGSRILKPTDPTRDGYEFDAWYKEDTFENEWIFATDVVESNITLYAKWIKEEDKEEDVLLSVSEVLEKPDLTYVEFEGIVLGFDFGKRHIIIEDKVTDEAIQLYKNPGYGRVKIGDEVRVKGFRTFDERGLDRIAPDELEIISSDNPSSYDNPTVIDQSELTDWTNDNRVNSDILFKYYLFTNVEIAEFSNNYTYIDNKYDEIGGRGLKIGIRNTDSFVAVDELNLVANQKYNIKALVYGVSDPFFDESIAGTVLRLTIMDVDDVEIVTEGEDATIVVSGQQSFLVNDEKPNFTQYFQLIDPVDGTVTVTNDMITENVDMTKPGTYDLTITYTNSNNHTSTRTSKIYVTEKGSSVTEALALADTGIDMYVQGVVVGWGHNGSSKTALIIEDPENGNAIEMWVNNNSSFNNVAVGDHLLLRSSALSLEKGLPRLGGTLTIVEKISTNHELHAPFIIDDLNEWSADLALNQDKFFGRYTFFGEFVETSGQYAYFLRESGGEKIVQLGIHQTTASLNWEVGALYKITGVVHGISDPFAALSEKSIVVRFAIMNASDIEVIPTGEDAVITYTGNRSFLTNDTPVDFTESFTINDATDGIVPVTNEMITEAVDFNAPGIYPVTLTYKNSINHTTKETIEIIVTENGSSVTEALEVVGQGIDMYVQGVVIGWGHNGNSKTALVIEDPLNGNAIEIWVNNNAPFNPVQVGDLILVRSTNIRLEKGFPRLDGRTLIKIISSDNELYAPTLIDDIELWSEELIDSPNIFGRYTFQAKLLSYNAGGYSYFLQAGSDDKIIQLGLHQSPVNFNWEVGVTYEVTVVVQGISDPISALATKSIVLRLAVMSLEDITIIE